MCCQAARGQLTVATADVDHAFEACSPSMVLPAWQYFSDRFTGEFGTKTMLVRRGRKDITQIGTKGFGRGWWAITVAH
eukprot:10346815-Heterocapsa_arctica.AAC.1